MLTLWMGALLFAYAGMLALCQRLDRHYRQVWGKPVSRWQRLGLRAVGWLGLAISFGLCLAEWGTAMGPVAWFGVMSLAGFGLVMLLPYAPRLAVYLGGAAGVWGVCVGLF